MDISKKVKYVLLESGITATDLADKMGMAQSNISYKLNKNSFKVDDLVKIAEVLGYDLEINFVLPSGEKI